MTNETTLFGDAPPPARAAAVPAQVMNDPPTGPFAAVAIEQSIDRSLDYTIPPRLHSSVQVGQRVKVPLGRKNSPVHGYVVAINPTTHFADSSKLKALLAIEDHRVLVPPSLMELARWMSRYYVTPLGHVLDCIIPSAVKKRTGIGYISLVQLIKPRDEVQALIEKMKAPKRRAVLARLLQLEPEQSIELFRLAKEANVKVATVRKLTQAGFISIRSQVDLPGLTSAEPQHVEREPLRTLNEEQQKVFDALLPRLNGAAGKKGGFSVNLLMGVTGSGKTEIYLQCIRQVVDQGRQAIVMVPEIALTPQTVRRFTARFDRVAVLHSGLSNSQRHKYWQQIATGQAQVVVGARSAIFAALPNVGMIIVDEEHESSYKQDQSPRYHGRDVAIKRAQIEGIPVLLGSATPSLEMYYRVTPKESGPPAPRLVDPNSLTQLPFAVVPTPERPATDSLASAYHLLTLPHRVRGLSLPHVELIDMKQETKFRRGVHLFSQRLEYLLSNTIAQGQQAILLLNRRGYSNYVHCPSCQHVMQCKYCDKTMTYHRSGGEQTLSAGNVASAHSGQLHCHYCLAVNTLPTACPQCKKKLSLFGLGTQRVEEEIQKKFPAIKFARVDSDTMRSAKDYETLLDRFGRNEVQVLLGTQMIAKGLDYPNVTLVGVISADTALALPDFRAAERTFQLITQVAGRAGRGDIPGRVVVQSFLPEDPAIQAAIRQDYVGFAQTELVSRKDVGLPPFGRMVRLVIREQDDDQTQKLAEELAAQLAPAVEQEMGKVTMRGPMPCAIGRIAGFFRQQILLTSTSAPALQRVLAKVRIKGSLKRAERIAVDVDPVSLL